MKTKSPETSRSPAASKHPGTPLRISREGAPTNSVEENYDDIMIHDGKTLNSTIQKGSITGMNTIISG
jgi:hypothetical protein